MRSKTLQSLHTSYLRDASQPVQPICCTYRRTNRRLLHSMRPLASYKMGSVYIGNIQYLNVFATLLQDKRAILTTKIN